MTVIQEPIRSDKICIHLSVLLRNDQDRIVTVKKEDCNVQ